MWGGKCCETHDKGDTLHPSEGDWSPNVWVTRLAWRPSGPAWSQYPGSSEEGPSLPKGWTGPHTAQMVPSPSDGHVMPVSLSQEWLNPSLRRWGSALYLKSTCQPARPALPGLGNFGSSLKSMFYRSSQPFPRHLQIAGYCEYLIFCLSCFHSAPKG